MGYCKLWADTSLNPFVLQTHSNRRSHSAGMLSSLRVGGPTALRRGVAALRPTAARAPLRCLASKGGRKKDAEESESHPGTTAMHGLRWWSSLIALL